MERLVALDTEVADHGVLPRTPSLQAEVAMEMQTTSSALDFRKCERFRMPAHREGEAGTGAGVCRRTSFRRNFAHQFAVSLLFSTLDCRTSLVPLPVTLHAAGLELATTSKVEMRNNL
jgi:hypothetical protein